METDNPIQEELAKLDDQWLAFQDSQRAILHWRFKVGDQQLSQAFVAVKELMDEEDPELFVQLKAPFNSLDHYAWDLAKEMIRRISDGIHEANLEAEPDNYVTWQVPDIRGISNGFQALFACCQAILDQFQDVLQSLVLVISPVEVKSSADYQQWWRLAYELKGRYSGWAHTIKWVVFDSEEQPLLASVFEGQPRHALSIAANVNVQEAIKKVAQNADDGSDGAKVRMLLLEMNEAIAQEDQAKMVQASALAIPIAKANEWLDVWTTLLMTRAGGWLNAKQYDRAIVDYREAQTLATQGIAIKTPGCDKLLLQALLCEGTSCFMANDLDNAVRAYKRTALKANDLNDSWMALEGWRMASYCLERQKEKHAAWECASCALDVGKTMSPEQREGSTLMFVGQALLRLSPNAQVEHEVKTVFDEWLGDSWQERLESISA